MKHTPTPWHQGVTKEDRSSIRDKEGFLVTDCTIVCERCNGEENAAFIVEAVNAHDRLQRERDAALDEQDVLLDVVRWVTGQAESCDKDTFKKAIALCEKTNDTNKAEKQAQ